MVIETLTFEDIKIEADKLSKLMEDPQPGLMSWWDFLKERMNNLAKIRDGIFPEDGNNLRAVSLILNSEPPDINND